MPAPQALVETSDGWVGFAMPGIGWVEVALARISGQPEIVGLRIDVRSAFVSEADKHVLDLPAHEQRQWAIDRAGPEQGGSAVITAERLRRLPLAELRAAAAARMAGMDAFGAFQQVARQRGKALPDEHFQQVAEVYRAAVDRRLPPLREIGSRWQVTHAAAAKYVKGARQRGYLGWPERKGLAGYDAARAKSIETKTETRRPDGS